MSSSKAPAFNPSEKSTDLANRHLTHSSHGRATSFGSFSRFVRRCPFPRRTIHRRLSGSQGLQPYVERRCQTRAKTIWSVTARVDGKCPFAANVSHACTVLLLSANQCSYCYEQRLHSSAGRVREKPDLVQNTKQCSMRMSQVDASCAEYQVSMSSTHARTCLSKVGQVLATRCIVPVSRTTSSMLTNSPLLTPALEEHMDLMLSSA